MKIFLTEEEAEKFHAVFTAQTNNFVELMAIAGIDPATDLVGSDLSGCDFSNCDLRGYNFTRADLTDVHGTDVIWDSTTILTDAVVTGSIFNVQ